jgi:hypothetical protein
MFAIGAILSLIVLSEVHIFGRNWQLHTLIGGSLLEIVGVQVIGLGLCAHAYATYFMSNHDRWFNYMRARFRLEHGLIVGAVVALVGLVFGVIVIVNWANHGFGALGNEMMALVAATLVIVGVQIFFTSFLLSIIGLRRTMRH